MTKTIKCPHCGAKLEHIIAELKTKKKCNNLYRINVEKETSKRIETYIEENEEILDYFCPYCLEQITFEDDHDVYMKISYCIITKDEDKEVYDLDDITVCHNCGNKLDKIGVLEETEKTYLINNTELSCEKESEIKADTEPRIYCGHCDEFLKGEQRDYFISLIDDEFE